MGQIHTLFCKKNSPPVDYDVEFERWKDDLFSTPSYCQAVLNITFENSKYYVKGSCFYDKKDGEPIGFKVYTKSQGQFPYFLIDDVTDEECSICSEKLQKKNNNKYVKLQCGHTFHEKCFKQWEHTKWAEGSSPNCPMCRYQPPNDDDVILRMKKEDQENRSYSSNNSYDGY
jgi:hypothetical protein